MQRDWSCLAKAPPMKATACSIVSPSGGGRKENCWWSRARRRKRSWTWRIHIHWQDTGPDKRLLAGTTLGQCQTEDSFFNPKRPLAIPNPSLRPSWGTRHVPEAHGHRPSPTLAVRSSVPRRCRCLFGALGGPPRPGVSNSTYLGAAGGRVWVRLGRIKYSTKKGFHVFQKKEHNLLNLYY